MILNKFLTNQKHNLLGAVIALGLLVVLYIISQANYLLFHSLVELFSVVIAGAIFVVYWNARNLVENDFFVFLAVAYLFVGLIDLIHALAYEGMGVFPTYDANLPTQLWIAARYLEGLSLLAATFCLGRKFKARLFLRIFAALFILILSAVFLGMFPDCYLEGVGLTPFKKTSEYLISLILIGAILQLIKKKANFETNVFRLFVASLVFTILSELAFTFYISVVGFSNFIGHIFKTISFYLIYLALVRISLSKPYALLFRDLKKKQVELEQSQRQLTLHGAALESTANAILITDREGTIKWVNSAWEALTGYSKQEAIGQNPRLLKSDRHDQAFYENLWDTILSGRVWRSEVINQRKDGSLYTEEETITPVRSASGDITHFVGVKQDITERKQVEEKLLESEALLRATGKMAKVGGWELDAKTQKVSWSEETYRIHEVSLDQEPPLEDAINFFHPEDQPILREAIENALKKGEPYDLVLRFITAKGNHLITRTICQPVMEHGQVIKLYGTFQDVTDLKQLEDDLRQERNLLSAVLETNPVGITMVNRDGQIIFANKQAEKILGLERDDITSRTFDDPQWRITDLEGHPFPVEDLPFDRVMKTRKNVQKVEHAIEWPDGRRKLLSIAGAPLFDSSGQIERVVLAIEDISDRVRAEKERQRLHEQVIQDASQLEKRVQERTQQLEKRVRQVEKLNAATRNLLDDLSANKAILEASQAELAEAHQMLQEKRILEQSTLLQLSQALLAESDPQAVMNLAVQEAAQALKVEFASLVLVDEDHRRYTSQISVGWPAEVRRVVQDIALAENTAMGSAIKSGIPVVVSDISQSDYALPDFIREMEFESRLIVPMAVGGRSIGGMAVNERRPRQWSESDIRLLSLIANTTAQTLERVRAQEALANRAAQLSTLLDISQQLTSKLDLDPLLDAIAEAIVDALPSAQASSLWLFDEGRGELSARAWVGHADELMKGKTLPLDNTLAGRVYRSGRALVIDDAIEDPKFKHIVHPSLDVIRSVLGVPLLVDGQSVGVLFADNFSRTHAFDHNDLRLLQGLGHKASIALSNALAQQALRQRSQELQTLTVRLAESEEVERRRLARELHDQVGQSLAVLGFNLNLAQAEIVSSPSEEFSSYLGESLSLVNEISQDIRDVMDDLRPAVLDDYGLFAALNWYGDRFEDRTGMDVEILGQDIQPRLDSRVETALFRITQEALANVTRHAQADHVTLSLVQKADHVRLHIEDDGAGFDPENVKQSKQGRGWGLVNMRERAEAVGGVFEIDSTLGAGTMVKIQVFRK